MKPASSKLILILGIGVWLFLALHIFFVYAESLSQKQFVKGGTFLQANIGSINYLPYISDRREDKYIQNFLFDGCSSSYVSGTDILYKENLCKISTTDNKSFNILVNTGTWSDGQKVTIDDVFFTYNNIIKNNELGLMGDEFSSIEIKKSGTGLNIVFPNNSYDNRIFFTYSILPAHILSGKNLEYYKDTFGKNIVTSSCAKIKSSSDINSFIIDLASCKDYYINNYQIKTFSNFDELQKYETANKNIDLYFSGDLINGFLEKKFLLNKFVGVFYNTENIGPELRQSFTKVALSGFFDSETADYLVKDQFIFNAIRPDYKNLTGLVDQYLLKKARTPAKAASSVSSVSSVSSGVKVPLISSGSSSSFSSLHQVASSDPGYITLGTQGGTISDFTKNYFVPSIDGQFTLTTILPKKYEYITISLNGGKGYSPKSFDGTKSNYNIADSYGNYNRGLSKYIITAYQAGGSYDTYTANIYFYTPPVSIANSSVSSISSFSSGEISASSIFSTGNILTGNASSISSSGNILSGENFSTGSYSISSSSSLVSSSSSSSSSSNSNKPKVVVIYLNEGVDKYIGLRLKGRIEVLGLQDKFDFVAYDDAASLQERIAKKDYDIVIRSINMGQKRDISPIFQSSDPNINLSQFSNPRMLSAIQQYFLAKNDTIKQAQKSIIDEIYVKEVPFVLLGKTFEKFYVRQDGQLNKNLSALGGSGDIVRIYDLAILKNSIQKTWIIQKPVYDFKKALNWDSFKAFLDKYNK